MSYIKANNRNQTELFPMTIDEMIMPDSPVILFDRFAESLDLISLGFSKSLPAKEGRPGYDPKDLLKLYLYGYFYGIRSSRKLARECYVNIEVMWLINQLRPDFRTISDFRKDNKDSFPKVFKEFNRYCCQLGILNQSCISIDGSKFQAVNSRDRNFTQTYLDLKISKLNSHVQKYLDELNSNDVSENRINEIKNSLNFCEERLKEYESIQNKMISEGKSQISLTDPESKLMKVRDGFRVGYNTQTAVDASSHLIAGYMVTDNTNDYGLLSKMAAEVKNEFKEFNDSDIVIETIADKGYQDRIDFSTTLENGIIPNVIQNHGVSEVTVDFDYEQIDVCDEEKNSINQADLKKCLHAGIVPSVYKDILEFKGIRKRIDLVTSEHSDVVKMSVEEMIAKAKCGYFVRNPEQNCVYCPQGRLLKYGCQTRQGAMRYWNKTACIRCKNKCTQAKYKEVKFTKDQTIRKASESVRKGPPKSVRKTKIEKFVVEYGLKMNVDMLAKRQTLSEHPFGTVKRTLNGYYLLLKGINKVSAEMSLMFLAYNFRRAINIAGIGKLISVMKD